MEIIRKAYSYRIFYNSDNDLVIRQPSSPLSIGEDSDDDMWIVISQHQISNFLEDLHSVFPL